VPSPLGGPPRRLVDLGYLGRRLGRMGELGMGAAQLKAEAESSGIWEGKSTSQNALPISYILIIWGFMISFMFQKPQSSQLQFRFFCISRQGEEEERPQAPRMAVKRERRESRK